MCGIIGYIGNKKSKDIIVDGLKRLEYRGYDSAGISTFESNSISTTKCKGKIVDLENKIDEGKHLGKIGIGHTRWATHGEPNLINAHPHNDSLNKFSLIHNGIIENHSSLRIFLEEKGVQFSSDTDTEVLVQFISYLYQSENLSFFETVKLALKEVIGTYGILVMCSDEPDRIIAARQGSPLTIGIGKNENYLASDISAIINFTRNIFFLDDGEIVEITSNDYKIKHIDHDNEINKEIKKIEYSLEQIEKGDFNHFMLKEIHYQPDAIYDSFRGRILNDGRIKLGGIEDYYDKIINSSNIYITACGTSWHAAQIGSYIFEELMSKPVKVEYASEFRYRNTPIDKNSLLIAISQSGETADTLAAIEKAKNVGALTLGIVNVVGSSIARETACGIYMHAGHEIGVASTKAFTSQVSVLILMGLFIAQNKNKKKCLQIASQLKKVPQIIKRILTLDDEIYKISKKFVQVNNFLYLGRGYQFPVALEGALKLKEISYIHAEGYPAAEMKHGPIALIDNNMPVVFIVTKNRFNKVLSNIQEVKSRGGKIICISTILSKELDNLCDHLVFIKDVEDMHTFILPLLTTIPLQLLAYHIAVLKGCNVDQPRNLAKSVTVE
ncbi:MAG: glutamine--fructose-6-phosphate transaminase (isomerizing) [Candidatus Marinimicrobia bacterium]|nr:glutamine--fructose-6-phosphate transaminase (isomerizing) [Candidatus Neomarinimicrobiota bacterium]